MFLDILLVVLGLAILSFAGYGGYLYKKKKERFVELKSIIEFVSFFLTAIFALVTVYQTGQSIKSSQEDSENLIKKIDNVITSANNAKDILDTVSSKLAPLPSQLNKFSKSISTLNSVVESQQKRFVDNISNLEGSVGSLTSNLKDYRNYINDYSSQLKTIVSQTDSQLKIWKDQQELVKKDYERKPFLSLVLSKKCESDSSVTAHELILINSGNIIAQIYGVVVSIPKDYVLPKKNFEEWKLINLNQDENYNHYQFRQETILSFPIASHSKRSLKIEIDNYSKIKLQKEILYEIFYESRFEDGHVSGIMQIY